MRNPSPACNKYAFLDSRPHFEGFLTQILANLCLTFGVPTSVARADFGPADHSCAPGPAESSGGWYQEMLVEFCSNS